MTLSLGPFITCFIGVFFLTIYLYIVLYHMNNHMIYGTKIIFLGITIILLRMCIPVNFPFTYTIYSTKLLPPITNVVYGHIANSDIKISDIFTLIWLIVAAIKLFKLYKKHYRLHNYIDAYIVADSERYQNLYTTVKKYYQKPIKIALIPHNVSPSITGLFHPVLIFPNTYESFSTKELEYICLHEINHYKKHDLWLRLLVEIVSCIHWWNPLIYFMKKEYSLALELVNDCQLMETVSDFDYLAYADLIIKTTNMMNNSSQIKNVGTIPFVRNVHSDLYTRINFLLKSSVKQPTNRFTHGINIIIICFVLCFSILIVIDPSSRSSPIKEEGEFEMDPSNTYFIQSPNGYDIYVEDNYVGTIIEIPDDFKNYKIYR